METPQEWEYKYKMIDLTREEPEQVANELGQRGWEMIGFDVKVHENGTDLRMFFKRAVPPQLSQYQH